jgi:hypothetical protein
LSEETAMMPLRWAMGSFAAFNKKSKKEWPD